MSTLANVAAYSGAYLKPLLAGVSTRSETR
jgi:hypothetical protein